MKGYTFSNRAQADLDEIWAYTESRWDADQAEKYIRSIKAAVEETVADPLRGRARDEVRAGYRSCIVGAHVLFYRQTPDGILVVRILHQRMDLDRHL